MRCVVIDDEPLARKGMQLLIEQVPHLQLAGSFSSVLEAGRFLDHNPVDLIFLDIQMPALNGIDFLRSSNHEVSVVITTAYPEFAVDAFEMNVVDYLVKPVRFERFFKAVRRVSSRQKGAAGSNNEDEYIFIRTDRKYVRTFYNDIDFIEGLKDYVTVHCGNHKHHVATNLKTIGESLPPANFLRVNKSFIVNMSKIGSIESDWVLIANRRLPIGESYRKSVLEFINNHKVLKRP